MKTKGYRGQKKDTQRKRERKRERGKTGRVCVNVCISVLILGGIVHNFILAVKILMIIEKKSRTSRICR